MDSYTTKNRATGLTPFRIVYWKRPDIPSYILNSTNVETVDTTLTTMDDISKFLKNNLAKAQKRLDVLCGPTSITYGFRHWWLGLAKVTTVRTTVQHIDQHHKLSKWYCVPLQVIERLSLVVYRLDQPQTSKIYLVFHISPLKPHKGDRLPATTTTHPSIFVDNYLVLKPKSILDRRTIQTDNITTDKVLIQCECSHQKKPRGRTSSTLWTRSILKKGGIVTLLDRSHSTQDLLLTKHRTDQVNIAMLTEYGSSELDQYHSRHEDSSLPHY